MGEKEAHHHAAEHSCASADGTEQRSSSQSVALAGVPACAWAAVLGAQSGVECRVSCFDMMVISPGQGGLRCPGSRCAR